MLGIGGRRERGIWGWTQRDRAEQDLKLNASAIQSLHRCNHLLQYMGVCAGVCSMGRIEAADKRGWKHKALRGPIDGQKNIGENYAREKGVQPFLSTIFHLGFED